MISERQNDGIERDRSEWFRRANSANPEQGGAPKSRTFNGREWMEQARGRWAELTNQMLETRGRDERVDHRSFLRQGIDREPGEHYGPAAAHMAGKGVEHERLGHAAGSVDVQDALRSIDRDIEILERLNRLAPGDERADRETDTTPPAPARDDDCSPGR